MGTWLHSRWHLVFFSRALAKAALLCPRGAIMEGNAADLVKAGLALTTTKLSYAPVFVLMLPVRKPRKL